MNNYLSHLPDPEELLKRHSDDRGVPEVNGHLHTPYSFCAFDSISQMFTMAGEEGVKLLGINDFYTLDGYAEFEKNAFENKIFPLFNIEFVGLMKDLQEAGVRVNDPANPGRVYFCGKGLKNPPDISPENLKFLEDLQQNSHAQIIEMCGKLDQHLREINAPFGISFEAIKTKYAKNLVRERHIARAVREASYESFESLAEKLEFFNKLFSGREMSVSFEDITGVENEIRSMLLKKGGKAFVPEDNRAFPELNRIIDFILDAGGIPCYPVLLDDKNGDMTLFEGDWDRMDEVLSSYRVSCLELIPMRNSLEKLEEFVEFFQRKNYLISFGTEHNSPGLFPLEVKVEKDRNLTAKLKKVSYEGACIMAAHQYLVSRGMEGFVKPDGSTDIYRRDFYSELGNAVIKEFTKK